MDVSHGLRFWTNFCYCKDFIYDAVTVAFEVDGTKVLEQQYVVNSTPPNNAFLDFFCDQDLELYSYYEVFCDNVYSRYGVSLEENDSVVDIGSDQGASIKYALSNKASTIISCEPNPYCIDTIKKYYGQNSNLKFNQYAISDKKRILRIIIRMEKRLK
jgi:hypothetical protein